MYCPALVITQHMLSTRDTNSAHLFISEMFTSFGNIGDLKSRELSDCVSSPYSSTDLLFSFPPLLLHFPSLSESPWLLSSLPLSLFIQCESLLSFFFTRAVQCGGVARDQMGQTTRSQTPPSRPRPPFLFSLSHICSFLSLRGALAKKMKDPRPLNPHKCPYPCKPQPKKAGVCAHVRESEGLCVKSH